MSCFFYALLLMITIMFTTGIAHKLKNFQPVVLIIL